MYGIVSNSERHTDIKPKCYLRALTQYHKL